MITYYEFRDYEGLYFIDNGELWVVPDKYDWEPEKIDPEKWCAPFLYMQFIDDFQRYTKLVRGKDFTAKDPFAKI